MEDNLRLREESVAFQDRVLELEGENERLKAENRILKKAHRRKVSSDSKASSESEQSEQRARPKIHSRVGSDLGSRNALTLPLPVKPPRKLSNANRPTAAPSTPRSSIDRTVITLYALLFPFLSAEVLVIA